MSLLFGEYRAVVVNRTPSIASALHDLAFGTPPYVARAGVEYARAYLIRQYPTGTVRSGSAGADLLVTGLTDLPDIYVEAKGIGRSFNNPFDSAGFRANSNDSAKILTSENALLIGTLVHHPNRSFVFPMKYPSDYTLDGRKIQPTKSFNYAAGIDHYNELIERMKHVSSQQDADDIDNQLFRLND